MMPAALCHRAHRLALLLPLLSLVVASVARADGLVELDVSLDPASRAFKASARLSPPEGDFRFVLHESLRVTGASAGGRALTAEAQRGPAGFREWRIRQATGGAALQIDYAGQLPALDVQRDHRSVLQRMPPMSSPEGSYLPAGSGWYPQAREMFGYRLRLSLPGEQRGLVAGKLLAETLPARPGEPYQASFEMRQPTDGIDLMAGPWRVREKSVARKGAPPLVLRTYFAAALDATPGLAEAWLDDSAAYIRRYSQAIGDYPYDNFSVVAGPLPTGFGMPTLTYLGEAVVRLPFIRKTSLGHEVLHNWWGNGVYVDYRRGNWSEGLTTFMADYAYRLDESPAAAAEMRLGWLRDALALPADAQPALRDFRSRQHGAEAAVGYGKAAMLFVMLQDRIGEAAFREGIRSFWAGQRFRTASWDELRPAFEGASGQRLGPFFEAWLNQRALPAVRLENASLRPDGDKHHQLTVNVAQDTPTHPLRLPLEVIGPGRREIHWVSLDGPRASTTLRLGFAPQGVRLDPDTRVWRRLPPGSLPPILRQWIGAAAPRLVNAGVDANTRAAVDALARRLLENAPAGAPLASALGGREPVILAGTHAEVDRALASAGLPPRPAEVAGRGSAQVWTLGPADTRAAPLAVISARDAAALDALQRGLPHYGAQSWLVFDGGRAIAKGTWPASLPLTPTTGR
ncbi:MAG: M1 family aminopeptidase [Zoogloea sp.]|uniref:M1 family metallopeptidase n=1 Tax=Zoogloea sp. TaxID=49181 RepID=UPI002610C379|nr:M1 family aminopeptidase [Zoogloea sp.]MDD3327216.1 M1 family aminopeptidase [Zoogloea sp.]